MAAFDCGAMHFVCIPLANAIVTSDCSVGREANLNCLLYRFAVHATRSTRLHLTVLRRSSTSIVLEAP
ncbi:hypothetical protein PSHT_06115 [Puccinia striiformis]|uniref:Secreted protein n=1 Tax=Puccinia striiformis TaxID=27350 RepID=A0A2S4W8U6_9BASI|nr:hypothetical protein PSHT_06115 [Puccinia striiformis]